MPIELVFFPAGIKIMPPDEAQRKEVDAKFAADQAAAKAQLDDLLLKGYEKFDSYPHQTPFEVHIVFIMHGPEGDPECNDWYSFGYMAAAKKYTTEIQELRQELTGFRRQLEAEKRVPLQAELDTVFV